MGLQGCTAASEDHSRFLRHLRGSSMGCNRPSDRGCSGRLDDDLGHRQRFEGQMMAPIQDLQLLVTSQTVHEFNQVIDALLSKDGSGAPTRECDSAAAVRRIEYRQTDF